MPLQLIRFLAWLAFWYGGECEHFGGAEWLNIPMDIRDHIEDTMRWEPRYTEAFYAEIKRLIARKAVQQ